MNPDTTVTRLLIDWKHGDKEAADVLAPLVYSELRRLAGHYLRDERAAATLQPTALVHEAYLRLVAQTLPDWESRSHFFGIAAHRMRQILVDYARTRHAAKRGGEASAVSLDEAAVVSRQRAGELVALDDALQSLAAVDRRKSQVVELRYFGGLSVEETAKVLKVSSETVLRDWRLAKTWLLRELSSGR